MRIFGFAPAAAEALVPLKVAEEEEAASAKQMAITAAFRHHILAPIIAFGIMVFDMTILVWCGK